MKFSSIPYERPQIDKTVDALKHLALAAGEADSGEALLQNFQTYRKLYSAYSTGRDIAYIRHSIDTRDSFFDAENDHFDDKGPVVQDAVLQFYKAVLRSPHKDALAKQYGDILLQKMELAVKGSDERLIALQQEENTLTSQYEKLYAGARIPFDGKEYTVAQLGPFKQSTDRDIRKRAFIAEGAFFDANAEALDSLYDRLVQNRTKQAEILG